jgi:hypothetical protein
MRARSSFFAIVVVCFMTSSLSAAVVRYQQVLDNGTYVTVDNASGWSQSVVANLVLSADRSTRDGCPYDRGVKGLFKTNDRIFVNQNYLAWFDYTAGDGVTYPSGYDNSWTRSGELAGFWTINPSTQLFKYYRDGGGVLANGTHCWNWPANELISGSASGDGGGPYWWDAHAPGVEHTIVVESTSDSTKKLFLSSVYAMRGGTASGFSKLLDGTQDAAGVHYKVQQKLTSKNDNGPFSPDIDGNPNVASGQHILAEIEYICRPDDILSVFKFKPSVTVWSTNINAGMWIGYAQDEDDTLCDAGGFGQQWPSQSQLTLPPRTVQSNRTLFLRYPYDTVHAANQYLTLPVKTEETCVTVPYHYNINYEAFEDAGLPQGTWLRAGSSSTIDASQPRWQLILLDVPGTGAGTSTNPIRVPMRILGFGNETHDGQVGAGLTHGVDVRYQLLANTWYQMYFQMQTKF